MARAQRKRERFGRIPPHCSLYNLHAVDFIQRRFCRDLPVCKAPSSGNAIDLNRSRKSREKSSMESLDNVRSLFLRTFIRPCSGFNRIGDGEEVLNAPPAPIVYSPEYLKPATEASLYGETGTARRG